VQLALVIGAHLAHLDAQSLDLLLLRPQHAHLRLPAARTVSRGGRAWRTHQLVDVCGGDVLLEPLH
jgi:hypothetical protein